MAEGSDNIDLSQNLSYLQEESIKTISIFTSIIGYVWLSLLLWQVTGGFAPLSSWAGVLVLLLSTFSCYFLIRNIYSGLPSYWCWELSAPSPAPCFPLLWQPSPIFLRCR